MERLTVKIAGQSGQGVNVLGEILTKAFKRSGLYTFGYREYPSLIKGGHSTYQIDVSNKQILSPSQNINILFVLNKQATLWYQDSFINEKPSVIFHDISNPRINKTENDVIKKSNTDMVYVPALRLAQEVGGNELTSNIVSLGTIWRILGLDKEILVDVIRAKFASKPKIVEIDVACAIKGFDYVNFEVPSFTKRIIKEDEISNEEKVKRHVLNSSNRSLLNLKNLLKDLTNEKHHTSENIVVTGNEAAALGAINAGMRIYYSYPMTPTSDIMEHFADYEQETGVIVKQAEDEITAAAMTIGSMHMGTRAMTGTSGGGFDLMTEHVSLSGMIEVPFVCILGQRPGPATGMPTWTTQGDLLLAINAGHGEFPRCVLAVKDAEDTFYKIQEAFNIAENFQIPVVVLTDKYIAESSFQINKLNDKKIPIERGPLVLNVEDLEKLKSTDRYKFTESGISPRWLPGSKAAGFNAQSDEHDEQGNTTEEAIPAHRMLEKRMKKMEILLKSLPEPTIYTNKPKLNVILEKRIEKRETENSKLKTINLIGWGSTYCVVKDLMKEYFEENVTVNYLHFEYIWPLRTDVLMKFVKEHRDAILVEINLQGQLGKLIRMETGIDLKNKILKWDGRPFFVEELKEKIDVIARNEMTKQSHTF
ncbi:MAG: 2-oxoacid:acceptor oxidoreductase subunit alpha [Candidatus Dojkabacteria bacterium]